MTIQQEVAVSITKKSETAKVAEVPTKVMEVTSSDDEFLEATITLERDEERNAKEKATVTMSFSKQQWS